MLQRRNTVGRMSLVEAVIFTLVPSLRWRQVPAKPSMVHADQDIQRLASSEVDDIIARLQLPLELSFFI